MKCTTNLACLPTGLNHASPSSREKRSFRRIATTLSQCLKIITKSLIFTKLWHFPTIFVLLKVTCLVTLFDRKVFKNSPKWTIFGIFIYLLSTQNVNVACFARNVEWDLSVICLDTRYFFRAPNIGEDRGIEAGFCKRSSPILLEGIFGILKTRLIFLKKLQ